METPSTYIPMDRRWAMAQGQQLPERTQGAALFADISGFTPLTEMLARVLGPRRGAEELTGYLNRVYDALITELHRYGGSVIGFSGDAITCWYDADNGRRAVATALAMQQVMGQFANLQITGGGTVSLAMKTAVTTGPVRRFMVGDPNYTVLDVMAGTTLERLAAAEHQAEKGDVILDAATATALDGLITIAEWRTDHDTAERFAVLATLKTAVSPHPWPALPANALPEDQVRSWLLPPVYRRLQTGQGAFLAELRPAAALFLRFGGIDYDADPDAPAKLDAFIRRVEQIIQQYDGSLLQLTVGDKGSYFYAAFGAPIAHEDDVARAALAALELQALPDELPFITKVQIGLTYGRMRVGAYGGSMRRTYGVLGDTVNLSARLMQAAQPGQILVSEEAQMRAGDTFVWEPMLPIRVKGKSQPIELYSLTRVRHKRTSRSLTALFPLPPIGREPILAQLENSLTDLLAGKGQVIRVLGEAGMGKSQLVAHFSRSILSNGGHLVMGVSQSITSNTPYHPWRQLFITLLGLDELSEETSIAQLTAFLQTEHPQSVLRLPLLGDLLGLPIPDNPTTLAMDNKLRQQSLFSLLVEIVQTWVQTQPLVLVLENAHWADEASLELIKTMAQQATSTAAVMVMVVHRPALLGEEILLPQLNAHLAYREVWVDELSDAATAELAERHLKGRPFPLLVAIVQHIARGNPFFIGELLEAMQQSRQLVEEGGTWRVTDELLAVLQRANAVTQEGGEWHLKPYVDLSAMKLGLPDSIHTLVLSRLDRLPEEHKLTLKVSSVIGHVVDLMLLAQAHPEPKNVTKLEEEAVYMTAEELMRVEMPERKLYAFRHHVTQEVTYETLLHTQRQQLHRSVAETLVEQQPEAVNPIAHHAFLGQLWPLALRYTMQAGEQARQLYANQQGIDFFQKALQSARELPEAETAESRKRIHLALGELLVTTGQYETAEPHLLAAWELAQTQGDWESQARSCHWYGRSYEQRGQNGVALEWLEKGFAALTGHTSKEEAELCITAGLIHTRQGNYEQALQLCQRSLQVGQVFNDSAVFARTYNLMGVVDRRRGNSDDALDRFTQSLTQYELLSNIHGQAISHNLIANGHFMRGEWSRATRHYRRALEQFTQIGVVYNQMMVNNNLGGIALKQGRLDEAIGYYQRALRLLEQIGGSLWAFGTVQMNLGDVYVQRGEAETAVSHLQQAQSYFATAKVRDLLPELYGLFAEATWKQGDLKTAETYGQQAIALAQELKMPREEGHTLRILGEIAQAMGDLPQAEQYFQRSYDLLSQTNDEYESTRTQLSWAALLAAQGRMSQAQEMLATCVAIFGRLEAQLELEKTHHLQSKL